MVDATFPVLKYEIAFTGALNNPASWAWTDVTSEVLHEPGWHAEYGSEYLLGKVQAGLLEITLDNRDGRFDPGNTAGVYYPNVVSLRPFRITATWASKTYPIFQGYVERWPNTWTRHGRFGVCRIRVLDAFTRLNAIKLKQALETEIRTDSPTWYYPLDEAEGSKSAGDRINPAANPALVRANSKYGGKTAVFGTQMLVDGTGVYFDSPNAGQGTTGGMTVLKARPGLNGAGLFPTSGGFSISMFVQTATKPGYLYVPFGMFSDDTNTVASFYIDASGKPYFFIGDAPGHSAASSYGSDVCDNQVHHLFATVSGDYKTVSLVVDDTDFGAVGNPSAISLAKLTTILIGGQLLNNGDSKNGFDGVVAGVAMFPGVISAARARQHYHAGFDGFAGEDTGARASRILSYAGWPASLKSNQTGLSKSGPLISAGRTAKDLLQETNNAELGRLYGSGAGAVTTKSRGDVYDRTAPTIVLGDGPGELPFEADVEIEYDPDTVINDAQITRTQGATITIQSAASIAKYDTRSSIATVNLQDDLQTADLAGFIVSEHAEPRQRVSTIRIKAAANPTAWTTLLNLDVGSKVRVIRRTPAGQTIQLDCVIDNLEHDDVTPPDRWDWVLQLVPATTRQSYWVLGDSTYGVLGTSTRLGY